MIIICHDPRALLGGLFGGGQRRERVFVPSPAADRGAEQRAAEEAARRVRAEAAQREGQRKTLLTPLGGQGTSSISTTRRTLLGAAPVS